MVLICFKALKGLNVNVNLGKSEAAPLGRVGNIIKLAGIFHCKVFFWGGGGAACHPLRLFLRGILYSRRWNRDNLVGRDNIYQRKEANLAEEYAQAYQLIIFLYLLFQCS